MLLGSKGGGGGGVVLGNRQGVYLVFFCPPKLGRSSLHTLFLQTLFLQTSSAPFDRSEESEQICVFTDTSL